MTIKFYSSTFLGQHCENSLKHKILDLGPFQVTTLMKCAHFPLGRWPETRNDYTGSCNGHKTCPLL